MSAASLARQIASREFAAGNHRVGAEAKLAERLARWQELRAQRAQR